ncbi:MAG: inositol monophosphatase family protein [Thermodesulfobacteriota bacterium]
MNEKDTLRQAILIAEKTGKRLRSLFRREEPLERGTVKEIKTIYDEIADSIIKEDLERYYPDHSYITEETGLVAKGEDYLWIIDPLDGTSNFANQNPFFAVSIALWFKGEPILGVIEAPMLQERYVAVKRKGAYHYDFLINIERRVNVSDTSNLKKAYILYCEGGEEDKERIFSLFKKYYLKGKDTRKLGSAAIEMAYVGLGRSDCYITTQISLWDIAAGILFVKEAGGNILHFDNTSYKW